MSDTTTVYRTGGNVPKGLAPMEDVAQLLDSAEEREKLKRVAQRAFWLLMNRAHLQASTNDAAWAIGDLEKAWSDLPANLRREIQEGR